MYVGMCVCVCPSGMQDRSAAALRQDKTRCVYVCMSIFMYVYVYVYMYIICVCLYVCMYVCM